MATLQLSDVLYARIAQQAADQGLTIEAWLESLLDDAKRSEVSTTDAESPKQEVLYRTILENFPEGLIAIFNHDLRYTVANGQGLKQIGMTSADLEGKRLRDVFSPEVYERDEPALLAALRGEKRKSIVEFNNAFFEVKTVPLQDQNGAIQGGMVLSQNITELKQAELRQKELLDQLALAIRTAKLGIWQFDVKTGHLEWNDQLLEIYGLTREEFNNDVNGWTRLLHPEDRAYAEGRFAEISTVGQLIGVRFRICRPNGEVRYLSASGSAFYDQAGNVSRLIGINVDITEFERAQQDLKASEARYRAVFDGSLNPIIVYDAHGQFLMLNEVAARNLGVAASDAKGRTLRDFFPEHYEPTVARIQQALETSTGFYVEDVVELNGSTRWFWSSIQPIFDQVNGTPAVQIISYDITEQKQAQLLEAENAQLATQLAQQQELAALRSKLLSLISHEFRTPLSIILSASENLSRYPHLLSTERATEKLGIVREQVQQLEALLDEISTLARTNRAFLNYHPQNTDVTALCRGITEHFQPSVEASQSLEIAFALTDKEVLLDAHLIRYALMNLVSNALKYSPDGGQIVLSVTQTTDNWQFRVSDQGIGIPEEDQPRLFQPFSRASNVGSIRGTGMGLTIVKEIAELHGGSITFESRIGFGSVFTLTIPLVPPAATHLSPASDP